MRSLSAVSFFAACLALTACTTTPAATDTGNGGTDTGTPVVDTGTPGVDTGAPVADTGTPTVDTGTPTVDTGTPAVDGGCDGVLLTIIDSSSWCDITVNDGTAFGGEMETLCVPAESDVTLVQTAHDGFVLGTWFGTDGDSAGAGEPGTVSGEMSTAHVTTGAAGTSSCVSTCCPFTAGGGCPATDACP
jgi:hypothetical protein